MKSICERLLLTSELNFSSQYLIRIFYKEKHGLKSVQTRSFFWSVFSCIWTEYGIEKASYWDTFHAVKWSGIFLKNIVMPQKMLWMLQRDLQVFFQGKCLNLIHLLPIFPFYNPWKKSGVFRAYKIGVLARNALTFSFSLGTNEPSEYVTTNASIVDQHQRATYLLKVNNKDTMQGPRPLFYSLYCGVRALIVTQKAYRLTRIFWSVIFIIDKNTWRASRYLFK